MVAEDVVGHRSILMNFLITHAQVVLPNAVANAWSVRVADGRILDVAPHLPAAPGEEVIDAGGDYLLPGFIDLHMHVGYLGLPWEREFELCTRQLPANGTTRFLPTLISALRGNLPEIFQAVIRAMNSDQPGTKPIGVHLEGPYIAMEARGGFLPEQITIPERFSIEPILDQGRDLVKLITLSPELPGIIPVIRDCVSRGIVVGMGHTVGDEAVYQNARQAGASHCTHTYNNRRTFPDSHLGGRSFNLDDLAVADDDVTCELICDGAHVKPVWVKTIYRTKGCEKLCLITDSFLAGRRSAEGESFQTGGGQVLVVRNGVGRDMNGALSGSVLTQDRAVKNFIRIAGATLPEAVRCASLNPARVLGMDQDFGSIAAGKIADLALLDKDMSVRLTWVGGRLAFDRAVARSTP